MKADSIAALFLLLSITALCGATATNDAAPSKPGWLGQPLSLPEALNTALNQNSTILEARANLEAAYGVVVQTRAVAIPKLRANGNYSATDQLETFPGASFSLQNEQRWDANIRLIQSIYEGGRIWSSLRTARLTKQQALLQYQTVIADALLGVRVTYADVLLAEELITVQEASVTLLQKELEDTNRRFNAGTVPRFDVLRAEVELANARPRLIRARNAYRIAKNNLANRLGYHVPTDVWEDIPLRLTTRLEPEPYEIQLPAAVARALQNRTEIAALQKAEAIREEAITDARAGYKPSVQLFAGYGWRNSSFSDDLTRDVDGWQAGAQMNWDIFDGLLTKGRIDEARALHRRARVQLDDATRQIELEVRTAYSNFIEAREVLESQKKVQEQAAEALRLSKARNEAGTGTQLDVLSAQTALTEARSTQVQAEHDYVVARDRLERAIGQTFMKDTARE